MRQLITAVVIFAILAVVGGILLYTRREAGKEETIGGVEGKRVLLIISYRDFRDEEFKIPFDVFTGAGIIVDVASDQAGKAMGALGLEVQVNLSLEMVDVDLYDAIIFVGGPGTPEHLWGNPEAVRIAKEAYKKGKIIGAICLAPGVLAEADIVNGVRVTAFHTARSKLVKAGAVFVDEDVVIDGNIITASGPQAARKFANEILKALGG